MTEQQQIDNLLIPRVMVTNEWPAPSTHSEEFKVGQVITEGPMYIMIWGRQYTAAELCAKFPGNFRLLHWSEGRTKNDMRAVTHFRHEKGKVTVAKKWDFLKDGTFEGVYGADGFWSPVSIVTPATSAQYLQYLNQQSKP